MRLVSCFSDFGAVAQPCHPQALPRAGHAVRGRPVRQPPELPILVGKHAPALQGLPEVELGHAGLGRNTQYTFSSREFRQKDAGELAFSQGEG